MSAKQALDFVFFEPYIVMCRCNKNQQHVHISHLWFNLIIVSSTCYEHPSFHPQEDLYVHF